MKEFLISLVFILILKPTGAQSISLETISSGGSSSPALSFTIGEIMSATHTNGGNKLTEGCQQQYCSYWGGKVNTAWNNLLNWKGGPVPNKNIDVIIPPGCPFYPIINLANYSCRSLQMKPGATFTIATGFSFTIAH